MDEEDISRFRSTFARAMADAGAASSGEMDHGRRLLDDDFGTEITSIGSNTSWSASWSPLPAASPPQCLSPEPSHRSPPRLLPSPPRLLPSSPSSSSTSSTFLRVQVESLTWQLNQMEVSYKMQRVVLEQMLTFLERLQTDLTSVNAESSWRNGNSTCSKCGTQVFPSLGSARRSSLDSTTKNNADASHLNGFSHPVRPGSAFENSPLRDCPWRRRRRESSSTERISSEAHRLMRTVRSVLAATTPEPHQLLACLGEGNSNGEKTMSSSQQSSGSSNFLPDIDQNTSNVTTRSGFTKKEEEAFRLVSECGQRLWEGQRAWGGRQKGIRPKGRRSLDGCFSSSFVPPSDSYNSKLTFSSEVSQSKEFDGHCTEERLPEEEESGFSSIGSFHEGIKTEGVNRGSFHEVGLPSCNDTDCLTVLWV